MKAQNDARTRSNTAPSPSQIQETIKGTEDVELTNFLAEQRKKGERLLREQAEKAHDAQVRKLLLEAAAKDEEARQAKQDQIDLSKTIGQLMQVAAVAAQRSQGMATATGSGNRGPASISNEPLSQKSSVQAAKATPKNENGVSLTDLDKELAVRLEAALAKAESDNKEAGRFPLTPAEKAQLKEKLRTSLRAKLQNYYKAQAAEAALANAAAYASEGQLKREPASDGSAETEESSSQGMGSAIGSAFNAYQEAGFSMKASETDAAVANFLDESNGATGQEILSAAGVLSAESPDLFLRISEAHRRSLAGGKLRR